MNGFINLLKTPGITSSTAVSIVKRIYGLKKVGHAGTLDPAAAGVLPIMINKATRLFDFLQDEKKEYISEFVFGVDTDSLDMQGKVLKTDNKTIEMEILLSIISKFTGDISQRPPKVSAISIDGKKAYQLQREEKDFEVPEKQISIYGLSLIRQTDYNAFLFKIICSKGTYIRSLCRDIAAELGTYGYVNYLLRTKSSGFNIESAMSVEQLRETTLQDALIPMDSPIEHMEKVNIENYDLGRAFNGLGITGYKPTENVFRVYCDKLFIGLGKKVLSENTDTIKIYKRFIDEKDI